ncbi:MAG TPA: hypothetical protein PLK85_06245 [Alphaproteobacteria bacterium]|nr:hypothetical protein [Alphaproteobacteria bacterium]
MQRTIAPISSSQGCQFSKPATRTNVTIAALAQTAAMRNNFKHYARPSIAANTNTAPRSRLQRAADMAMSPIHARIA